MTIVSFVHQYALTCYTFDGNKEDYFVARLIHRYVQGPRILDLGCGPVEPIVSVFYRNAHEVVAVDRLQENLDFSKRHSDQLTTIINRALLYKHRYLSKKDSQPVIRYIRSDVTKKLGLGTFHSVLNLGCFGALDTQEQFQKAVDHAYASTKNGGTLLMVNWVGHVWRPYKFNGKVNEPDVYEPTLRKAGFRIQELHTTSRVVSPDTRRKGYKQIIWAVARKP